jgi:hypothetical protein
LLIQKISNTLQISSDSLEDGEIKKKIATETVEEAEDQLLKKYQKLSRLRDENIKKGNTELDIDTLHALQEAYLIANHMNWLKSLSENLQKAIERYRIAIVEEET